MAGVGPTDLLIYEFNLKSLQFLSIIKMLRPDSSIFKIKYDSEHPT